MQELLDLILKNITLHPEEVVITVSAEDDSEVYTISVNPEDMGRVIGKAGKVIRAIRSLAHVVAIRQNKRFRINLAESGEEGSAMPEATESREVAEPVEIVEAADLIADSLVEDAE
jgi:uncharacterized protein